MNLPTGVNAGLIELMKLQCASLALLATPFVSALAFVRPTPPANQPLGSSAAGSAASAYQPLDSSAAGSAASVAAELQVRSPTVLLGLCCGNLGCSFKLALLSLLVCRSSGGLG